jgi:hypothetical protein
MKSQEIIRIIIITLVGGLIVFWLQPQLYILRLITVADVPNLDTWLQNSYNTAAAIVFGTSVLATLLWMVMTATAKVQTGQDVLSWQLTWWLIGLLPLIGICVALWLFGGESLYPLTGFFVVDALILYWLTTATSSPGLFKRTPPGASLFR